MGQPLRQLGQPLELLGDGFERVSVEESKIGFKAWLQGSHPICDSKQPGRSGGASRKGDFMGEPIGYCERGLEVYHSGLGDIAIAVIILWSCPPDT